MKKNLTKRQALSITVAFLLGNTLAILGSGSSNQKLGYLTYIPAFVLFVFLMLLYRFIFKKSGEKSFFEITAEIFPPFISKMFFLIIFLYSFTSAALSCGNFMFFASVSTDSQISFSLLALFMGFCIFFILSSNKKTLGRYCELVLPFILFLIFVMIVSGIFKGDTKNLYIEFPINIYEVLKSTAVNFFSPFANIFLIVLFMKNMTESKNIFSLSLKGGLISAICLSLVYFVNLITLGRNLLSYLYYPTLFSFGVINPGLLTQRSETIYYVSYVFFDIIYIVVSLFVSMSSFSFLFFKETDLTETKKRTLSISFSLILVLFMIFFNFTGSYYNLYTSFLSVQIPVTIGFPVIVFLRLLFKDRKNHSSS